MTTYPIDITREADVVRLLDRGLASGSGRAPADLVVYNAGNNRRTDSLDVSAAMFEDFWRVACFGGVLVGREAARRLVREYGPLGIHVAHVVIDGGIARPVAS